MSSAPKEGVKKWQNITLTTGVKQFISMVVKNTEKGCINLLVMNSLNKNQHVLKSPLVMTMGLLKTDFFNQSLSSDWFYFNNFQSRLKTAFCESAI